MKLRTPKLITMILFSLTIFLLSVNVAYADSVIDQEGRVKEFKNHETHSSKSLELLSTSNVVSSEKSYAYPDYFSNQVDTIGSMTFHLRDSDYNKVTGNKVNKIEIIQNGKKLVSTSNVKSYSVIGRYRIFDANLLGSFQNSNGENKVDIVFYLYDKEVARIKDFTIKLYSQVIVSGVWPTDLGLDTLKIPNEVEILNAREGDSVDVWYKDQTGKRITDYDGLYNSWYDDEDKALTVSSKLALKDSTKLSLDQEYSIVVEVNGKEVDYIDEYHQVYIDSEPRVYLTYWAEDEGKYYYRVGGINLLTNGPYKLEIKQNGKLTGTINKISAYLEDDYYVMIKQDITNLLPNPEEEYLTFLYDKNGNLIDEKTWNEPEDEITEDVITPGEDTTNYSVFPKKTGIAVNKDWVINFNFDVNAATINPNNLFVENASTGVKVDTRLEVMQSGKAVKVYHPNNNYTAGATYYLKIKDSIKSTDGKSLKAPVKMEFVIK